MRLILAASALAFALPLSALAAGSDSSSPPTPTDTTKTCKGGMVFDDKSGKCVAPKDSRLDDDDRYDAVREFAYAGQYRHALAALDAMSDQQDDRVYTYRGFIARKSGDVEAGMTYYQAALQINPDNLLVRSYMGQAFVEMGLLPEASAQLTEIRRRGGRSSWPEFALRSAIEQGKGFSY
ncbi:tetratricopeptide repeat protein [Tropicimonas sp. TH_r6]|uniref:tetratricopeptide repeat protein n=1 Tax=Tropicimonas sp. TH_r6 TaxID=3082085 RepID=UPI0029555821|nr:tetratricopeptide repeat protein [Tropicimonas sp. TH_r6]MDV7142101.1 tetratricopeptide repeat protein [Tropicimonas sp. TH_r6]